MVHNQDKCKNCFWHSASLKTWPDFECKPGVDNESKIKSIRERKCQECKQGQDNYSDIWKCRKCNKIIGGHQSFLHDSLCESCDGT